MACASHFRSTPLKADIFSAGRHVSEMPGADSRAKQNATLHQSRRACLGFFDIKSATVTDPPYVLEGHARSAA